MKPVGPAYDFTPIPGAKTFFQILVIGTPHASIAMLAAEELQTLGGWDQLRAVDPTIWAQLCRFILKNDPLH